jgi:signal transduction histidine kinase
MQSAWSWALGKAMRRRDFIKGIASSEDFPPVISAIQITERQTRIALGVVILLLSVVVIVAPFSSVRLPRLDAFLPVVQAVMCVVDIITAAFLFAQYSIYPKYALLAVASAYVFSGLFAFIQTLAFPGAYSETGLIGDGVDTAAWIFVLWHTTFLLGVIAYALSKDTDGAITPAGKSTTVVVAITIACVLAATVGLTWIVIESAGYLPRLFTTVARQTLFARGLDVFLWLLSITTLVLLFVRRRTILDLWLVVILLAWWPNFVVAIFVPFVRFSLGWYASRFLTLTASSILLFVLLAETTALYNRLAGANILLRRERENRLMNATAVAAAIAHEIKQPLTAIITSAGAAKRFATNTPPNQERVQQNLEKIASAGHRTGEIIDAVRALFGKADQGEQQIDMNELILDALQSSRGELEHQDIETDVNLKAKLPLIQGNLSQLRQVVLNLIHNAIEAMATTTNQSRTLRVRTESEGEAIAVTMEDNGPGIPPQKVDDIFNAFVTSKSHGMGLGLAISRTIVESHGGQLIASSDGKSGALFRVTLPLLPG